MTLRFLIEKEVRQLLRNSFLPRMIVMMPLMMMLVLPWAANQEVTNLGLCVVDHDGSTTSQKLTHRITGGRYFRLTATTPTFEAALQTVERGEADLILEIPRDFERQLVRKEHPKLYIAANSVNGSKGTIGSSYLAQMVSATGASLVDRSPNRQPEVLKPLYRFNPHLDYKVYMVPAMMVMLLTIMTGFLPALNIVGEKEAGTIEQINVSPISRLEFILAKLFPYWIIGLFIMSLCLGLAYLVYGLSPVGSMLTVYLFSAVYILVVSGMALVISNYSETMQQAVFVMYFFIMILILMSGLLTPVRSMPDWAQTIAVFNPLKYFIEVMRSVFLKGSTLADLLPNLYALIAFATFFCGWAIAGYRKRE